MRSQIFSSVSPPLKVKGPRMSLSRSSSSDSSSSSRSLLSSTTSRTSIYTSDESPKSTSFPRPSGSRSSCGSESFYCTCGDDQCTLRRRAHIRRQQRHKPKIRPLPAVPRAPRPLPRPVVASVQECIRKLPVPPDMAITKRSPFPTVSPTTCTTPAPLSFYGKSSPHDAFTPEIDWDVIMVEIVHSGLDSGFSSDADSIYE